MQCEEHLWTYGGTCVRCGMTRLDAEAADLIEDEGGHAAD